MCNWNGNQFIHSMCLEFYESLFIGIGGRYFRNKMIKDENVPVRIKLLVFVVDESHLWEGNVCV